MYDNQKQQQQKEEEEEKKVGVKLQGMHVSVLVDEEMMLKFYDFWCLFVCLLDVRWCLGRQGGVGV